MHRVSAMAKYINDVKGKVRLKLVSMVATIRQNVLYLNRALWYVSKMKETMIDTLIDRFQQKRWTNTNADVSRKKLLNNNGDVIKSEALLYQKWCINGKIMWQWMFIMFVADELNANVSYY